MKPLNKKRFVRQYGEENHELVSDDFATIYNQYAAESVSEGKIVIGLVVAVDKDSVLVDVGIKNEGRIPLSEFALTGELPEIKVGDKVKVCIEKIENRNGITVLSREKAIREEVWEQLEQYQKDGKTIDGVIFARVKGGFTVDLAGVVAFLPGSQVDVRPIKDIGPLMGIVQPFMILKMDRKLGNIVVSRRAILEESRNEARDEILANIKEGQIVEGIIKNITDYGAFIDLGNLDGLLHVTDISWSRINHPSEILNIGQKVRVVVTKFNEETKRISLGMKQLEENPWKGIELKYPKGKRMTGKITNITDYGAFIELEPGIEGLVYVSEISWNKSNQHPRKLLNIGQEVDFMLLEIDADKHRISLGIKQCTPNPWQNFAETHKIGEIITLPVRNVADFGIFVALDNNIDGLIHVSDISWNEEEAIKMLTKFKKDEMITCKVLGIDIAKERISLGVKQLESEAPIAESSSSKEKDLSKGDVVHCVVTEVKDDGLEVTVNNNESILGFIKKADLAADKTDQKTDNFKVGDSLNAKVSSVDKTSKKLNLSVKALEIEEQNKILNDHNSAETNLGAALNKLMNNQ